MAPGHRSELRSKTILPSSSTLRNGLSMRQKRAYRYRCYPTQAQAAVLARTFGCARFVYNWALRLRTDAYYQRHECMDYGEVSAA
jgi:Helix-turn-helix domain